MAERIVYPGHPVHIAIQIMDTFPSYQDAISKPEGVEFNKTLSCSTIRGTGAAVSTALQVLDYWNSGIPAQNCYDMAVMLWGQAREWGKGDYGHHYEMGVKQAERLEAEFLDKLEAWSRV